MALDAVFHLGGISTESHGIDSESNIIVCTTCTKPARKKGVKRILFASSNPAIVSIRAMVQLRPDMPPRRIVCTASAKSSVNVVAFYFDRYGIETACLRIGRSFPEPANRRMLATLFELRRFTSACSVGRRVEYARQSNLD